MNEVKSERTTDRTAPIQHLCFHGDVPVYPYVVAVTGHRSFYDGTNRIANLPAFDEETVRKAFKQLLRSLAKKWRTECKGTAPLILLTSMADGTDQLAAEAALELKGLNVKVVVLLPMEQSVFRKSIDNKERFDRILSEVSKETTIYEMPLARENVNQEEVLSDFDERNEIAEKSRQMQYKVVAEFLALHCHTLFSIWDGINCPDKKGGTSCSVRFKLEGDSGECIQERSDTLTFSTVGPVVQILVTRDDKENRDIPYPKELQRETEPPVFIWTREHLPPLNRDEVNSAERIIALDKVADEQVFSDVLPRLARANVDSDRFYSELKNGRDDSQRNLGILSGENIPLDQETNILLRHYTCMDTLANFFRDRTIGIIKWYTSILFLFLLFGGVLSAMWSIRQSGWGNEPGTYFYFLWANNSDSPFDSMLGLTIVFWVSFAILVRLYLWTKHEQFHRRYHRYRTLAEALRIQIFWRIAGMSQVVSGYYRSHQVNDLTWLRCALNGLDVVLSSPRRLTDEELCDRINYVWQKWINDVNSGQIPYFECTIGKRRAPWSVSAEKKKEWLMPLRWLCDWIFRIVSFAAENQYVRIPLLVLLSLKIVLLPVTDKMTEMVFHWGKESDGVLLLIGGLESIGSVLTSFTIAALLYVQLMRFQQEASRYERILYPYERANILLNRKMKNLSSASKDERRKTIEDCQNILCNLGAEALSENAEWLLSVGERELTLPR